VKKKTVKLSVFYAHLGPTSVKAALKTLIKLTLDIGRKIDRDEDELTKPIILLVA